MFISLLFVYSLSYDTNIQCTGLEDSQVCYDDLTGTNPITFGDGTNDLKLSQGKYACCRSGEAPAITINSRTIPQDAFYKSTKIKSVTIGSSVASIGNGAFFECTNLQLTWSSNSITTIGDSAFEGCINLQATITFGSTLTSIGDSAFKDSTLKGTTFSNDYGENLGFSISAHAFENTKITLSPQAIFTIPNSCFSIGKYAFARVPFNGPVSLCNTLTSIPQYLFYNSTITRITYSGGDSSKNSFHSQVTSIDQHAFDKSGLEGQLDLGDNIRAIGAYAFKSTRITGSITLPDVLMTLSKFAFYNCTGINGDIIIPQSLTTIGDCAFEGTQIEGHILLKTSITTLGKRAFARTKITDLTIYINIPESTFEGVDTLKTLYVNGASNTIEIDANAFKDCTISDVMEFDNAEIKTDAFYGASYTNKGSNARLYFIDSTIGSYAFRKFIMSDTLINITDTTISDYAFETLIGKPEVIFCHDEIVDEEGQSTPSDFVIGQYAFYNTDIKGDLEIPYSIKLVRQYAFAFCSELTGNLYINATYIATNAFYSSGFSNALSLGYNVQNLNIASSYDGTNYDPPPTVYGEIRTFRGCNFKQVSLSNQGSIPYRAFYQMTSIRNALYIPKTITSIETEAFAGCTEITGLTFEEDQKTITGSYLTIGIAAFMGCIGITNKLVLNRALYYNGNNALGDYAFCECTGISSLIFEAKLGTIGKYAFYHCTGLTTVSFPIELTKIDNYAFAECTSLTGTLVIPRYTTIGNGAFMNCAKLTGDLDLSTITSIGSSAFAGCTELDGTLYLYKPMRIVSSNAIIGSSAFSGCRKLKGSLYLNYFNDVQHHAFYDCSGLNGDLTLWSTTSIGEYTFYRCSGLKGVITTSRRVEKYAFYGCSSLTCKNLISDSTQYIGEYAFAGCKGLSGPLEFPGSIYFIGKGAFSGCSGFSDHLSIQVGNTRDSENPGGNNFLRIDERAFEECSGFKKGYLSIYIDNDEEIDQHSTSMSFTNTEPGNDGVTISNGEGRSTQSNPHYRYDYFLRIQHKAFEKTKFKNIYYNGRFQPDCDFDIGISSIKGIHTSANYANKTFCGNPIHSSKLSGGAIAGIVIACIVVVAAIIVLVIFLIKRNKQNKDNSEGEVEMNNEP